MKAEGYSIKDLEVLSGIKAHTIRIWEKRYNVLRPSRTETNIRYYSVDDLRRILNISLLVKNGYKISKVSLWGEHQIHQSVLTVTENNTSENDLIERLLLYMLNFDNKKFNALLNKIILDMGLEEAVTKVFFLLFIRIGTYWQVGSIFPAQEHYVTNIFRQKIISETEKLGIENTRDSSILLYLPENELHEMSLLFYAYMAKKLGYNVIYLGQFVPFDDLRKIQQHIKIDYVFTAFINSITKEDLDSYLIELKNLFATQKIFITGWQIHTQNPELPRNVKVVKDYREFKRFLS